MRESRRKTRGSRESNRKIVEAKEEVDEDEEEEE